jgi:hypothetical protein
MAGKFNPLRGYSLRTLAIQPAHCKFTPETSPDQKRMIAALQWRCRMSLLRTVIAMFCLVWIAGCSFQSDVILPDARAAGDPIAGFPTAAPFKLESFDRQKNAYHYIGTGTPEMIGNRVRYTLAFEGDSKKLLLQAKQLSENNYVLRYAELGDGVDPNIDDSALVFVNVEDGTYYVLMSLADKALFEKVYRGVAKPSIVNDTVKLDMEQAARLSAFFGDHRDQFLTDQDYVRIRLMK